MDNSLHKYVSRDVECLCDIGLFPGISRFLKPTAALPYKAEAEDVGREGRLELSSLPLVS